MGIGRTRLQSPELRLLVPATLTLPAKTTRKGRSLVLCGKRPGRKNKQTSSRCDRAGQQGKLCRCRHRAVAFLDYLIFSLAVLPVLGYIIHVTRPVNKYSEYFSFCLFAHDD